MTGTTGRRGRLGCVTIRCMAVLVIGFLWCGVGFCSVESASVVPVFPGGVVSPPVSDSNGASSAPVNVDPVDMETEVGVPVELVGSAFDPTSAGLTHVASQWQLRYAMSAADFSDTLYDSGSSAQDLTSIEIGAPFLDFGTSYTWRVRYADDSGSWTDWSQQTTFQTELQRYAGYETFSFDGEVQDVLLDETRNRFWALRKDLSRVEAYDLQTLEQIASVATGMEPESFAMTWDKRYLGVGSRANTYLTVVDLESDLSGRLGLFSSLDGLKVFRVASLNTGDLIFVTRPDTYGSPPFGGHVHLWHGDTHAVEVLSFYDGANNTIFGLGAADKYLLAKWGFSQGGIQLWNVSRAPFNAVVQDEHFASLFIGADTFVGADPVHGQFIIDNDLVDINGTDLDFRTEIPAVYNGTEPVFNPADGDEVVMSASLSKTLAVWHLSDLQPHLTINLPNGLGWAGRGQFSDDGQQILLLLKDGSNSVVSYHYVPLVNPFTITTPTQSAVDVPVQPLVAISGTYDPGAQHALSHWQMRELFSPADYSERVFDTVTSGSARHAVRVDTVTLSGQTEYALRMRYRNTSGTWSAWCEESHFTTVYVPPTETPTPTLTPTPTITPTVTPTPDASATPTATPIPMVPENQAVHITSDGHFYAIGYGYESGRLVGWVDAFTQATMSFDLLASDWVGLFVYDYGEGSVSEALYIWYSPLPRSRAQGCMSGSFSAYSSTSVE